MKYKIRHDRPGCIGCTMCANIAPKHWEMSDLDGQADLIGGEEVDSGQEKSIDESEFQVNMDAAESCPVNVIHLIEIGSGKELI